MAVDAPTALCVDLDGTLIRSDLLFESFFALLKRHPFCLFLIPFWLMKGKAILKDEIAQRVCLDISSLPYNQSLINWLIEQKSSGHVVWLCTASNYRFAELIASYLGFFDGVMASNRYTNLSGFCKAARLVERFGEKGFDYCGNDNSDIAIWQHARISIVVNGGKALEQKARTVSAVNQVFSYPKKNIFFVLLKAIRIHQWTKNILVFVPLIAAHKIDEVAIISVCQAFLAFCFCASSVYILNDMLDLESDRHHLEKRNRPFAAGDLPLKVGLIMALVLLAVAAVISVFLPINFIVVIVGYYMLTVAYSFALKRKVTIDIFSLAGLYTIRIVAGASAALVTLSFWLLALSIFFFLSLALVKRYAELSALRAQGKLKAKGRGYHVNDLPALQGMGIAAGYLSVLVLMFYINSPAVEVLYSQPHALWLLSLLHLYWITHMWMKASSGGMNEDPLIFAFHDATSRIVIALAILSFLLALMP